jgi:2-methylcitrate dehydratase PrpD
VFKRHACCGVAQPTIDAIQKLVRAHALRPADVASVEVSADARVLALCRYEEPDDELQARFSLPFAAALGLSGRSTGPEAFSEQSLLDGELAALARRVTVAEQREPSTRVTIEVVDGRRLERIQAAEEPAGDDELRAQWQRLTAKLRSIVTPLAGEAAVEETIAAVAALDERMTAAMLLRL